MGLALRVLFAWHLRGDVAECEADGFVRAWEGLSLGALDRMRPPLSAFVLHALSGGLKSVFALRLACVAVSVAGFLAAAWTAGRLAQRLRAPTRSLSLAGCWLAGWWALSPTLVASACRPTADLLLGPCLALLLGAVAAVGGRLPVVRVVVLCAATILCLLSGGVVVAAALAAGLVVFLLPLPPLATAVPPLLAMALAAGGAWLVQRGPDAGRPWLPETAPALSLSELLGETPAAGAPDLVAADARAVRAWTAAGHGLRSRGPLEIARAYVQRLVIDQLGPDRFADRGLQARRLPTLPVGLCDAWIRGGLLFFAAATLALLRRSPDRAWPRAGVVTSILLLVPLLTVSATGPFALAPLDLPILALAAAGVAAADPRRSALRWGAFAIGGTLMLVLVLAGALSGKSPDPWTSQLGLAERQGSLLVSMLQAEDPPNAPREVQVAGLLMSREAPFQRLPEAARRHALLASLADPLAMPVLQCLVAAHVENGDYGAAQSLAESLRDGNGQLSSDGRMLVAWIQQVRHDLLAAENL